MYFVRLSVDQAWMAFRAGQMMIIGLAVLSARFVAASTSGVQRVIAVVVIALAVVAGAPTTIIDEYNAQDIHNLGMGPGFPWTIVITVPQQRAYAWIRDNTPTSAVVQMDARSRERSTWTNISSFAERRMAGGLPISLLKIPEYMTSARIVFGRCTQRPEPRKLRTLLEPSVSITSMLTKSSGERMRTAFGSASRPRSRRCLKMGRWRYLGSASPSTIHPGANFWHFQMPVAISVFGEPLSFTAA